MRKRHEIQFDDNEYEPVPETALRLFRQCWQIESWLRTIVYVQLRASQPDWEKRVRAYVKKWPPSNHIKKDQKMRHMKTAHASGFSYLDFTALWDVISAAENWPLFEEYFPPSDISAAKIEEVVAIRNRVAHFRTPHRYDCERLVLFVQDIEAGIKEFCTRYAGGCMPSSEAEQIIRMLESNWANEGYGTEMQADIVHWLYAPEPYRAKPRWNAHFACSRMLGSKVADRSEIVHVDMIENKGEGFDLLAIFNGMKPFHDEIVHFTIFHVDQIGISLPICLGSSKCFEIISKFFGLCRNHVGTIVEPRLTRLVSEWPEFVLLPTDILANYHPDHKYDIISLT